MNTFNPVRLAEARAYRRMTGEELANNIGVSKQSISQFENNKAEPEYDTLVKISSELGFPIRYFYEESIPLLEGNTYFRALYSSNKRELLSQRIKTRYVAHIHHTLSRFVDFRPYNVPELIENTPAIEKVAQSLRDYWGLGQEPIPDMIALLERNGIIMSEFATDSNKIDAFSQYGEIRGTPYRCVVLGMEKRSYVRRQFSCAHELGHIFLHEKFNDLYEVSKEDFKIRENEANEFASCFLLPRDAFRNDLCFHANKLNRYIDLKRKWKVSISAMVMRARALEAINQNQYQYLMRQISGRGWRTEEPLDECFPIKRPKAMKQAINLIILNNCLTGSQLMKEFEKEGLSLPKEVIEEVLNLESETITIEDANLAGRIIPFAQLKEPIMNDEL